MSPKVQTQTEKDSSNKHLLFKKVIVLKRKEKEIRKKISKDVLDFDLLSHPRGQSKCLKPSSGGQL